MDRKKELKESYKLMKPEMGVFVIRSIKENKGYLESHANLKGYLNRILFQLRHGSFPKRELQKEWNEQGESGFVLEILEIFDYDEDESKKDYTEELTIMKMIWEEKMIKQGMIFYN